jgi:hypothetical protein
MGWGVAYYLGFLSRQDVKASYQHVAYQHSAKIDDFFDGSVDG